MVNGRIAVEDQRARQVTLEDITWNALDAREWASICHDGDLLLAMARLRDWMAAGREADPILQARYQALQGVITERQAGRAKRRWWAPFSTYRGTPWAVDKLTRDSRNILR